MQFKLLPKRNLPLVKENKHFSATVQIKVNFNVAQMNPSQLQTLLDDYLLTQDKLVRFNHIKSTISLLRGRFRASGFQEMLALMLAKTIRSTTKLDSKKFELLLGLLEEKDLVSSFLLAFKNCKGKRLQYISKAILYGLKFRNRVILEGLDVQEGQFNFSSEQLSTALIKENLWQQAFRVKKLLDNSMPIFKLLNESLVRVMMQRKINFSNLTEPELAIQLQLCQTTTQLKPYFKTSLYNSAKLFQKTIAFQYLCGVKQKSAQGNYLILSSFAVELIREWASDYSNLSLIILRVMSSEVDQGKRQLMIKQGLCEIQVDKKLQKLLQKAAFLNCICRSAGYNQAIQRGVLEELKLACNVQNMSTLLQIIGFGSKIKQQTKGLNLIFFNKFYFPEDWATELDGAIISKIRTLSAFYQQAKQIIQKQSKSKKITLLEFGTVILRDVSTNSDITMTLKNYIEFINSGIVVLVQKQQQYVCEDKSSKKAVQTELAQISKTAKEARIVKLLKREKKILRGKLKASLGFEMGLQQQEGLLKGLQERGYLALAGTELQYVV